MRAGPSVSSSSSDCHLNAVETGAASAGQWLSPADELRAQQIEHEGQWLSLAGELRAQQTEHESRVVELLEKHEAALLKAVRLEIEQGYVSEIRFGGNSSRRPSRTSSDGLLEGTWGCSPDRPASTRSDINANAEPASPRTHLPRSRSGRSSSFKMPEELGSNSDTLVKARSFQCAVDDMQRTFEQIKKKSAYSDVDYSRGFSVWAKELIQSRLFEHIVIGLIVFNALSIGVYADLSIRNLGSSNEADLDPHFRMMDLVFTLAFTGELCLRLAAEGMLFFNIRNRYLRWNVFETVIVISTITEELVGLFLSAAVNVSLLRLLRIMRLVRVVRVVRVMRFFKDLRIMVAGIASSSKSLMWAAILLVIIIYVFAVCVIQVISLFMADMEENQISMYVDKERLMVYFGGLTLTMYTLFKAICGGVTWGDCTDALEEVTVLLIFVFIIYICFSFFCVLNIITGVFVENAHNISTIDEDKMVIEHIETKRKWLEEVRDVFQRATRGDSDRIGYQKFQETCSDVRVQALFRKLGLEMEADRAYGLFQLFDFEKDGTIGLDEFASGIQEVHGHARSLDVFHLRHETKSLRFKIDALVENVAVLLSGPTFMAGSIRGARGSAVQGLHGSDDSCNDLSLEGVPTREEATILSSKLVDEEF